MFVRNVLLVFFSVLAAMLAGCTFFEHKEPGVDEHGCNANTGFEWCPVKQRCIYTSMEKCFEVENETPAGSGLDAHGCNTTASYSWCDLAGKCIRPGEACEAAAEGCDSPYDGRWNGTVTGSGMLDIDNYRAKRPFTVTYDLEITIKCDAEGGPGMNWRLKIVRAMSSHPYFGCADGCTPVVGPYGIESTIELGGGGLLGNMNLYFPNNASISLSDLQLSQDGRTITKQCDDCETRTGIGIGYVDLGTDEGSSTIMTYNCPDCVSYASYELNKIRMELHKK